MRVSPDLPRQLFDIHVGQLLQLQDIDGERAIFTASDHWYVCHVDELVEFTAEQQGHGNSAEPETVESWSIRSLRQQRVPAAPGPAMDRQMHIKGVEDVQPSMSSTDSNSQKSISGIRCEECQKLMNAFVEAVHEVLVLNEKHVLAVIEDEPDPHRFDLLIHAANENKQNAKYAYVQHKETHGCSC
jgi:hypothetical protein